MPKARLREVNPARTTTLLAAVTAGCNPKGEADAMAFYELTYIIRPDVPTTTVDAVANKVADLVKKHKGKIVKTEQWGLRTLAYPIKKHRKGYYSMAGLSLSGAEALADIEYQLKLSDEVVRFMTIAVDDISKEPSAMLKAKNRMGEGDSLDTGAGVTA